MPEFVMTAYGDRLNHLSRYDVGAFWGDALRSYYRDAADYAAQNLNTELVVLAFQRPDDVSYETAYDNARQAVRAHMTAYPDAASPEWCANNAAFPFKYAGKYWAVGYANRRIYDTTVHECAHCALVAAREQASAHGQSPDRASVMLTSRTPPEDYMPTYNAEIAGEVPASSSTIKDYGGGHGYACGNCGRLGHNSRACTYVAKHFDKVGIEIEGRFFNLSRVKDRAEDAGLTYSGDGSIRESPDTDASGYEFKSKPGSLREAVEQLVDFYPDETDYSCGMHIHVSFPQDCLTLLQTQAFFKFFKERWEAWGAAMNLAPNSEFYKRLRGENDYCNPNEEELRIMTSCDRYSQLNFGAYSTHKTVECRLLPMFRRSSLGVAAVRELINIYEDFLADPEAYGVVYDDFVAAGADTALLAPQGQSVKLDAFEIDVPAMRADTAAHTIELAEILPPAAGMTRIALPVNQAITVEALSARLTARAA